MNAFIAWYQVEIFYVYWTAKLLMCYYATPVAFFKVFKKNVNNKMKWYNLILKTTSTIASHNKQIVLNYNEYLFYCPAMCVTL